MPTAQFFTDFKKRRNSTKRPTIDSQYNFNVEFKQPTDIYHPTLIIRGIDSFEHVTYMYMDGWYYYVNRIVSNRDFWEVSAEIDELATWKSDITGFVTQIARASDANSPKFADRLAYGEDYVNLDNVEIVTGNALGTLGTYIIALMGNNSTQYVATSSYLAICNLLSDLCNKNNYTVTPPANFNPLDYVYKCYFVPCSLRDGRAPTITGDIGVGIYTCNIRGSFYPVDVGDYCIVSQTFSHPLHPQTEELGIWVNQHPYSQRVLRLPPFGDIQIDYPASATGVRTNIRIDMTTGDSILVVDIDGVDITQRYANLAVDMRVSHSITPSTGEFLKTATVDLLRFGQDAYYQNISGAIDTIYNGVQYIRDAGMGYSSSGSQGSFGSFRVQPKYINTFLTLKKPDYNTMGKPCMETGALGSHSGFVQATTGDVPTSAPQPYKDRIKGFVTGGIYIE